MVVLITKTINICNESFYKTTGGNVRGYGEIKYKLYKKFK